MLPQLDHRDAMLADPLYFHRNPTFNQFSFNFYGAYLLRKKIIRVDKIAQNKLK